MGRSWLGYRETGFWMNQPDLVSWSTFLFLGMRPSIREAPWVETFCERLDLVVVCQGMGFESGLDLVPDDGLPILREAAMRAVEIVEQVYGAADQPGDATIDEVDRRLQEAGASPEAVSNYWLAPKPILAACASFFLRLLDGEAGGSSSDEESWALHTFCHRWYVEHPFRASPPTDGSANR